MRNRRLEELAERVAALEDALAGGRSSDLDTRLLAIETALRRLNHDEGELAELGDVVRDCDELLAQRVPAGERVMVAWRGEVAMLGMRARPVVPFPPPAASRGERDFVHGASAIAHLESQRTHEIGFLLIPEQARRWLEDLPAFREHLSSRYELVADEEGAGLLFDVGSRRNGERSSEALVEVLDRILDGERYAPVLDWTGFGLNSLIPERGVFAAPPDTDGELPYLDRSIEVVIVDDPTHVEEGRRVATSAVVLIEPDEGGGIGVAQVEEFSTERSPAKEITVITGSDSWAAADEAKSEVVALAEDGVLPLPGCLEAAAATLQHHEGVDAVAVKLLDGDGLLEGAGFTVFADGSAEGVGAGSAEVSAPWHEFVRPVCAGGGLLVARTSALRGSATDAASLIDVSGRLRTSGHGLIYQPDAWAVRAQPHEPRGEPQAPGKAWTEVLSSRPERPETLDDSVWRWLLVHDDVAEAWR